MNNPDELLFDSLKLISNLPGLFKCQGCCSGKAAAHEIVAVYIEWAATKPV